MRKNRKKNIFLLLFVLLCSLGIGYAFLRTELSINGTADFLDARWDIHFNNVVVNPNSVELSTGNTAATISTSTTEVTYAVTLKEPGDFYEFTVDAVNAGTIDGMIDTISSKMGGVEITTLPAYMEYFVTYSDGIELAPNQYLKAGSTETYKVHIGFKKDINASDLTGQVENKALSFSVTYVQADENAVERPVPTFADSDWDTIINTIKSKNSCGPYNVGDFKEIDMGTFGTHTLRIANCSRPTECSTEGFSQTACGVVLEFVDIITTHRMNPYNNSNTTTIGLNSKGGWVYSDMRAFLNSTTYAYENINYSTTGIYSSLPEVIKNAIIDTAVVSGHGSTTGETNFNSTDKLYLLSTHEVWEDVDENTSNGIDYYDTAYNNTRQLDYYKGLNVTTSNYSSAIKKNGTSNSRWWLRSAISYSAYTFYGVTDTGRWYTNNANNTDGVSPAFRFA